MMKKKTALLLLAAVLMIAIPWMAPHSAQAADAGADYAKAAQLFIREKEYYGNYSIWCSIDIGGNTYLDDTSSWCGYFVSSVAKSMGIPSSVIPRSGSAAAWAKTDQSSFHSLVPSHSDLNGVVRNYSAAGNYDPDYVPQVGDIVTLCHNGENGFSHVGIVTDVNTTGKTFSWVSGNYSRTVRMGERAYSYVGDVKSTDYYQLVVGFFHPDWSKVSSWNAPNAVTAVSFPTENRLMDLDDEYDLSASVSPSNAFCDTLIYTSSNSSVVEVDKYTGKLYAVGEGSATVTARAIADGKKTSSAAVKDSISITVRNDVLPPSHVTMSVGETYQPLYMLDGQDFTCRISEGSENVSLSSDYALTALNAGTAVLEVEMDDSIWYVGVTIMPYTVYCEIYDRDESGSDYVYSNADREFYCYLLGPSNDTPVFFDWESSDESILQIVSEDGSSCKVRAMGNGTAELSVTVKMELEDGLYGYTEIWEASRTLRASTPAIPLAILVQPTDARVNGDGDTVSVSVEAQGEGLSYSWIRKYPYEDSYVTTTQNTATYTETLWRAQSGMKLFCLIEDQYGNTVTTDEVVLTVKPVPASSIDLQEYKVVYSSGLKINYRYNRTGTAIKTMPKGTYFWADENTRIASGNYDWCYCYLADGTQGWVAVSNGSYCVPEDNDPNDVIQADHSEEYYTHSCRDFTFMANQTDWVSWSVNDWDLAYGSAWGGDHEFCRLEFGSREGVVILTASNSTNTYYKAFVVRNKPIYTSGDYKYSLNQETETSGDYMINAYTGSASRVIFPAELDGHPISAVGANAIQDNYTIEYLAFEEGIGSLYENAFDCGLMAVSEVHFPASLEHIANRAFFFDGYYYCDFYFEETSDPELYGTAIGANYGSTNPDEGYFMQFHVRPNMSAANYAADHWIPVRYYDDGNSWDADAGWTYSGDTLTIWGTGAIPDYDDSFSPWDPYFEVIEHVVLEEGIYGIGNSGLSSLFWLRNVTIHGEIEYVGDNAFWSCTNLTEIHLEDALSIGDYAFEDCHALAAVYLDKVTSIGEDAFAGCENLTIFAPAGSYAITYARENGIDYYEIHIDNVMTNPDLVLPDDVTEIGDEAFRGTFFGKVKLPEGVTRIGDYAFADCLCLQEIYIPGDVEYIGEGIFENVDLYDFTIYCIEGTNAHVYAMENGIQFKFVQP